MYELIDFAPGVKKVESVSRDTYIGSGDALIAVGVVELRQLPGQPGSGKVMASFLPDGARVRKGTTDVRMPGRIRVRRRGKGFEVDVWVDACEAQRREARRAAEQMAYQEAHEAAARKLAAEHERERAYKQAQEYAARELAAMPCSAEAYREQAIDRVDCMLVGITKSLGGREYHGYSYEPATIRDFQAAVHRLFMVLRSGKVVFDQQRHDARIAAINAEVAKFAPAGRNRVMARPQLRLVQTGQPSATA